MKHVGLAAAVSALGLSLGVAPATATPPPQSARSNASIFGLNLGRDWDPTVTARDVKEAANLGARWARFGIAWNEVEPRPGRLDLSRYDRDLRVYRRKGLAVIGLIQGAPAWACAAPYARTRDLYVCPPRPGRAYKRFVRRVIAHFKGRIGVWEVWSEPDHKRFWKPKPNAVAYARLLKVTYGAVKAVDPTATVLVAATAGTDLPFTAAVLRSLRGVKAFDALAAHPYRLPYGPLEPAPVLMEGGEQVPLTFGQEMLAVQDTFELHGYGRPDVWITEIGWGADDVSSGDELVTLDQQAEFLQSTYELASSDPELAFIRVVCWFAEQDSEQPPTDSLFLAGLLRADYGPKPAADVYRQLATGG